MHDALLAIHADVRLHPGGPNDRSLSVGWIPKYHITADS